MRDGEVVSVIEGNKWKSTRCTRVSQVLPSSRPYKVETAGGRGNRRNRRHLLRTEESQIPRDITPTLEVSNDEDLTDTKVEPSSVTVAHENPGTPPAGMSMATTTRSGQTVREPTFYSFLLKHNVSVCRKRHIGPVAVCLFNSVISAFFFL